MGPRDALSRVEVAPVTQDIWPSSAHPVWASVLLSFCQGKAASTLRRVWEDQTYKTSPLRSSPSHHTAEGMRLRVLVPRGTGPPGARSAPCVSLCVHTTPATLGET